MFKKIEKFTVGVKYTLEYSLYISKEGIKFEAQHQGFTEILLSWYMVKNAGRRWIMADCSNFIFNSH